MKRLIVFVFALLALWSSASASFPPPSSLWRMTGDSSAGYGSQQAAVDAYCSKWTAGLGGVSAPYTQWKCGAPYFASPFWYTQAMKCQADGTTCVGGDSNKINALASGCPVNSSGSSSCTCNAGFDESGGQCVPHVNQCTAKTGTVGVTSWTQGYTRTPDEGDVQGVGPVNRPPSSGTVCDSGCSVSLQMAGPGVQYYVSQAPTANGLYRRSVDYPNLNLGTECTAGTADAPVVPTTPDPPCPGSVGTVNGKVMCVGTASKPVTTTPLDVPPSPPIAGNPAAGLKPPTGDGSGTGSVGRTPSAGNGGNAGGPAAAAVGGKGGSAGGTGTGSGTTTAPGTGEQQQNCGAPGQPACKLDETGTPTGVGTLFDAPKTALDGEQTKVDTLRTTVQGNSDKGFFQPFTNLWAAPPVASCSPIVLPQSVRGLSLDPCGVVDGVRNVMAYIWALAALWLCFGMIKRVI